MVLNSTPQPARNRFPGDLALAVCKALKGRRQPCPDSDIVTTLFETMYFASLIREEAEPITVSIVYANPQNPDPQPPKRIVRDRWRCVRLGARVRLTTSNLSKIAKASDPRSSSLAVYPDAAGRLYIWGMIDQGNRPHGFVTHEGEMGQDRPGLFHATIAGPAHLVVFAEYKRVAELKVNRLAPFPVDVLRRGLAHQVLEPGIKRYLRDVNRRLPADIRRQPPVWPRYLIDKWVRTLCRLLLRVQSFRHGGAILLAPESAKAGLNIKYPFEYDRLATALRRHGVSTNQHEYASDAIFDAGARQRIPAVLHWEESAARVDLEESQSELEGTLWFMSLLTRVDGLLLLTLDLVVRGYGVEITVQEVPGSIVAARDPEARRRRRVHYNHFGTRHRSMMRYCARFPGSIGFVVSQDGVVRAMTRIGKRLVIWEDIKLLYWEESEKKQPRKSSK